MLERRKRSTWASVVLGAFLVVGATGCAADRPDGPTIANLADFAVNLTSTPVHLGTNTIVIHNAGAVEHEFIGFKIDRPVADLELNSEGNLNEEALTSVTDGPNMAQNTSSTRIVELTEPGTYLFLCNLPTHFRKGMYTTLTLP
jgi:uncharacterized cupredoxin-like copper-binding protein